MAASEFKEKKLNRKWVPGSVKVQFKYILTVKGGKMTRREELETPTYTNTVENQKFLEFLEFLEGVA